MAERFNFEILHVWSYHHSEIAKAFATDFGFAATRELLQLSSSVELPLPSVVLPSGFRLRAFQPGYDNATWLALNTEIFANHPENGHWQEADLELRLSQKWFDANDFLILEDDNGQMVGFNWTKLSPPSHTTLYRSPIHVTPIPPSTALPSLTSRLIGEIYIVGVSSKVRGRNLGKVLTVLGLQHLKQRGATELCFT